MWIVKHRQTGDKGVNVVTGPRLVSSFDETHGRCGLNIKRYDMDSDGTLVCHSVIREHIFQELTLQVKHLRCSVYVVGDTSEKAR
ncbi:hypothetical protein CEXT_190831 [Caerostris extrusa]|uniref:Uncharacterized protein n=1 Tax=Caerostris extrusa TaxID=172846 RepID=A0AAV4VV70_CAEEX|nr:hypothetical protein CEXT_190831 [Caerostris extrusa]